MRVFITDSIKGKAKELVKASGTYCGNHYKIHDKVYIFNRLNSELFFAVSEQHLKDIHGDIYEVVTSKKLNVE